MILGFIDLKTFYTIVHLMGVVLGAGGAAVSGVMFLNTIRDRIITKTEIRFLKLGSVMVWVGVAVVLISGSLLFSLDPTKYFASSKFLSKMAIVVIIICNGVLYHLYHLPKLIQESGGHFTFRSHRVLFVSGGVSLVSWVYTVVLGALKTVPYSFATIMLVYVVLLVLSIIGVLAVYKIFFSDHTKRKL
jgi:hypothetical protein